ncbi:MAG: ABC transporter permease [Armatimonadetes bacterium]|nr:ABC transporter permease [Armatimonadota bacterium]
MKVIFAIARTTVGEAIRRKILLVILLIGVLFLVIAPGLNMLTARQEQTVLISLTLGVIQLTSAVLALVLTVYMIPNEIERRTIYTILAKPVQRWQFVIGKYLGAIGALGLMMALMTFTLIIVYAIMQGVSDIQQLSLLAKAPLMFFVQMCLLSAVAVTFSTFVAPMVNFFLSGGVYLLGSLFNSLLEIISDSSTMHPAMKVVATVLSSVVPNFQNFNVQNSSINASQVIRGELAHFVNLTAYGVTYILVLLFVGILIFDRREV